MTLCDVLGTESIYALSHKHWGGGPLTNIEFVRGGMYWCCWYSVK